MEKTEESGGASAGFEWRKSAFSQLTGSEKFFFFRADPVFLDSWVFLAKYYLGIPLTNRACPSCPLLL